MFIWYGGLIRMAEALGQTGLTKRFAEPRQGLTTGWKWWLALASLLLIYFYAHYVFASITAHVTAMFRAVSDRDPAPRERRHTWRCLSLAYFSNLGASLTHYGTTPAPIYFGAGYTTQRTWWWLGLITSVDNDRSIWSFWFHMVEDTRTLVTTSRWLDTQRIHLWQRNLESKKVANRLSSTRPKDFERELGELPDNAEIVKRLTKPLDIILLFVQ